MAIYDLKIAEGYEELESKLEPRVKEFVNELLSEYLNMLLFSIDECESPIERLIALALYYRDHVDTYLADDLSYVVNPQEKIRIDKKTYRVDFLINSVFRGVKRKVVVECDGHDFHEKTKEQARRDKERDRALIKAGYEVIRFTGSEINESPHKCARQISEIVFKE